MQSLLDKAYAQVRALPSSQAAMAMRGPAPARKNQTGKTAMSKRNIWGIQVGAFYTRKPAASLAKEISRKYARILKNGQVTIMPLQKSRNRILYRARILGIRKQEAYRACRSLKKYKRPCMLVKLPAQLEIAAS